MSFSISTHHFPPRQNFSSYENALKFYESIKPKRDGTRPLTTNRKGAYTINKWQGNIELVYYSTAVVTITPENKMKMDVSWGSISTRIFADYFSPPGVNVSAYGGYQKITIGKHAFLEPRITFDLNTLEVTSTVRPIDVYVLDRKRAAPVQQLVRKCDGIVEAMLRVAGVAAVMYQGRVSSHIASKPADMSVEEYVSEHYLPLIRNRGVVRHLTSKRRMYEAYGCYDKIRLPYGTIPKKGQEWEYGEG